MAASIGVDGRLARWLRQHERKSLLRFITCGSVDDGKSTLIGRLLWDSKVLHVDQSEALRADSRRHGTQGEAIDYALLLDGLDVEREQGITIDVAYRFFDSRKRKYIVADCPGHLQYTRNMATGASTADVAVVLVDASKGLQPQTRRHSFIVGLMGIGQVILAVNKMDLVGYREERFQEIVDEYRVLAFRLGIGAVTPIPVAALHGDNLIARSPAMPWYTGASVLQALDAIEVDRDRADIGFRMPVQWVARPDRSDSSRDFRGLAGTVAAGVVAVGDEVVALPSGQSSRVRRILGPDGERTDAACADAITLVLADELDIGRGDMIAARARPPQVADQFAARLLWMDEQALLPGRPYWLKLATATATASITEIKYRIDVDTQAQLAAKTLKFNEIGYCNLGLDRAIAFEPYADNRQLGGFILIDRQSNATVGAGMLEFALRRAANIHWHRLDVDRAARARSKGQQARCVWFTGLSGAGKSTIANLVDRRLHGLGMHAFVLDGDNVRHGLNKDLGFTQTDRVENIRRVAEVAKLMTDAGLIVLVSFISPFRAEREMARALFPEGEFIEVFVDTPLEVAERRDAKGLYAKARRGELPNFTGIDSPYQAPENPDLHLHAALEPAEALAERVVQFLLRP